MRLLDGITDSMDISLSKLWVIHVMYLEPLTEVIPAPGKVKVKVIQSHLTLSDPVDCSPPGSPVHGILQARILEWVAFPFSSRSSQSRDRTQVSCIALRFFTS